MNIVNYVETYGDRTFSERPLNEVDSLIFCELSYLCFTESPLRDGSEPLGKLAEAREELIRDTLLPASNEKLLRAIAKSRRFSSVSAFRFREFNDEAREVRFAAITFDLGDGNLYCAFRGTDVTLLGWKEDFNMAFRRRIPSQKLALDYLSELAESSRAPLFVGGHSKGGNLAVYAAVNATRAVKKRIAAVYDHDGPGFRERIFSSPRYLDVEDRIRRTVPHDSLIGILLFHSERQKVVLSRSVLIGQHNPFAWAVKNAEEFVGLPSTTANSKRTDRALGEWIAGMDEGTRKKFVDALFAVISGSGAQKVTDFKHGIFRKIRGMRRAYKKLSKESRALIRSGGKRLIAIWLRSVRTRSDG